MKGLVGADKSVGKETNHNTPDAAVPELPPLGDDAQTFGFDKEQLVAYVDALRRNKSVFSRLFSNSGTGVKKAHQKVRLVGYLWWR